ncbi:MAG: DUF2004 domain-containing protein [Candidatus Kapabacteria bacterium]|nr:DUF2004 domain-containing protein [Candidatus Kapabacteria bacterium]
MENIELPYFGKIDFSQLKEYYSTEVVFNGNLLAIDINFEHNNIDKERAVYIRDFLDRISAFDIHNKVDIESDFDAEGEAADYINFYFDELEEELEEFIDYDNNDISEQEQLLQKLRLIRVGLYPNRNFDAEYYSVFDYSIDIDGEPCNQLLVVKRDINGKLVLITWES